MRTRLVLSGLFLLAVPTAGLGQDVRGTGNEARNDGSWWAVSIGAAGARLTCDLCQFERDLGPSVDVSVGTYAFQTLRVGVSGGAWTHDDDGVREGVYRAGIVAEVHPRPASGLHLSGGVGWSGYRAEEFAYDAARLTLGVGWDLPFTRDWVIGNAVTLDAASFGSLKNGDTRVATGVGMSVLRLSVYVRHR